MGKPTEKSPELLDRIAAAAYLGVEPETLAVWASQRRYNLAYIKVGSKVRYRRSDLDAWLRSRTIRGVGEERPGNLPADGAGPA